MTTELLIGSPEESGRRAAEGVSLDPQSERIAGWATSSGMQPDPADVDLVAGISGKRPALRPALEVAGSGGCILVV